MLSVQTATIGPNIQVSISLKGKVAQSCEPFKAQKLV